MRENIRLCIASPNENGLSETFIRAHVERLFPKTLLLFGGYFPYRVSSAPSWRPEGPLGGLERMVWRAMGRSYPEIDEIHLARWLRRQHVDAMLCEYGPTGVALASACQRAGIPLVVHFHGYDAYQHATLDQYREGYRKLFSSSATVIAVSRAMENQLLTLGARRDRLVYNPYGVDLEQFAPTNRRPAGKAFFAVGRFVEKKAPHLTLLAFKAVAEADREARLVMVGDGPLLPMCQDLAVHFGLQQAVQFLGAQPPAIVQEWMKKCFCFVQHSVTASDGDSEGTPVAIIEAQASGLPVVATRHAGIEDVVVEGKTGLLVPEKDVQGMAEAMRSLMQDPDQAVQMGQAARYRAEEHFGLERHLEMLRECIRNAVAER